MTDNDYVQVRDTSHVGSVAVDAAGSSAALVGVALGAVTVLVVGCILWGDALLDSGSELFLSAPPFSGSWTWRWPVAAWGSVAAAIGIALAWPLAAARLSWRLLLSASAATSLLWTVALAGSEGLDAIAAPLTTRFEYLPYARSVASVSELLQRWPNLLSDAPTHVRGHPPGTVLGFAFLDGLGVGDLGVALVVLISGASAAPAALIALDRLSGRAAARRAAVFVGLAPAVLWSGTSVDGMAMGISAWAVALAAVAATSERGEIVVGAAVAAGTLAGVVATMTYGAPALLGPLGAVACWAAWRRQWMVLLMGALGLGVPVLGLAAAGFDWSAGFAATMDAYRSGVAEVRPGGYFAVANLAVLVVAIGPATVAAIMGLRDRMTWVLVAGALAGILVADVSGMSKGEVERIWLPLIPFLVVATCSLRGLNSRRLWLGAQLAVALGLQAALHSPW